MARAHLYMPITTSNGDIIAPIIIRLLEPNSTTEISETVYTAASGTSEYDNAGFLNNDGVVDVYLDEPRRVRLGITPPGQNEMFIDDIDISTDAVLYAPAPLKVTNTPSTIGHVLKVTGTDTAAWGAAPSGGGGGSGASVVEMTRADALSADLPAGTYVLITDGPTIGTPEHTSETQVLVQYIATDNSFYATFARGARVFTSFAVQPWNAQYDINTGKLQVLEDHQGNIVRDLSSTGAVLHEQFPWGYAEVRGNLIEEPHVDSDQVTLTGWGAAAAAGVTIHENTVRGIGGSQTVVDLTGMTHADQRFAGNLIEGANVEITTDIGALAAIVLNTFRDGFWLRLEPTSPPDAAQSPPLQIRSSTFEGYASGGSLRLEGASNGFSILESHFKSGNGGSIDLVANTEPDGTSFRVLYSELTGVSVYTDSTAQLNIVQSKLVDGSVSLYGGGYCGIEQCQLADTTVQTEFGSDGTQTQLRTSEFFGAFIDVADTATQHGISISWSSIHNATIQQRNGALQVEGSTVSGGSVIENTAIGARALVLTSCTVGGGTTISQQRTANVGYQDDILNSTFSDATVTVTGSAGTTTDNVPLLTSCDVRSGGTVTIADPAGGTGTDVVGITTVEANSTLNVAAGGRVLQSRFGAGAVFNTGAFVHQNVVIDGAFTKTATAANTNTLKNKAFDDIV